MLSSFCLNLLFLPALPTCLCHFFCLLWSSIHPPLSRHHLLSDFIMSLLWVLYTWLSFHPLFVFPTSFWSLRSSSLRLLLTFISCCTLASEEARAFFTSRYSCNVMGPSDRSDESILWIDRTFRQANKRVKRQKEKDRWKVSQKWRKWYCDTSEDTAQYKLNYSCINLTPKLSNVCSFYVKLIRRFAV